MLCLSYSGWAFQSHEGHDTAGFFLPTMESTTFGIPGVSYCFPGRSENMAMDYGPCKTRMPLLVLDASNIPAEL